MSIQNLRMMPLDRIEEDYSNEGGGEGKDASAEKIDLRSFAKKHGKRQKDKVSGGD